MRDRIICGDVLTVLKTLPDNLIHCVVTSPPYWGLRDYGMDGQLGLEPTLQEYIDKMVVVFREVRRVLKDEGTLWLNMGDGYNNSTSSGGPSAKQESNKGSWHNGGIRKVYGLKPKDLVGQPWRLAFALQADGWYLRSDIIWAKPNPMPESVTDRSTKSHEYIFLMSKKAKYYYDAEAVREEAIMAGSPQRSGYIDKGTDGISCPDFLSGDNHFYPSKRNKRTVWTVATQPFLEAHFATFPEKLIEPCIRAGCPAGGLVLDPFMGSGTTALVAVKLNRKYIGIELNPEYIEIANRRLEREMGLFITGGERAT